MARDKKPFEMTLKELIEHPDEETRTRAFHLMHRLETIYFVEGSVKISVAIEFPPFAGYRDVVPAPPRL